ncbi:MULTISPECIES: hypothetical protein [unclassified Microcoleus]|uniref:hypothetical protein n=1 Tax=unclassified Microcoleus TaxID=2642155 RepID=UPI002FD0FB9C
MVELSFIGDSVLLLIAIARHAKSRIFGDCKAAIKPPGFKIFLLNEAIIGDRY